MRSHIHHCVSAQRGAMYVMSSDQVLTFDQCNIHDTEVKTNHAGLGTSGAGVTIIKRTSVFNAYTSAADAGCLDVQGGHVRVESSLLDTCKAVLTPNGGYGKGGCAHVQAGLLTVRDSTFARCEGVQGVAIMVYSTAAAELYNASIVGVKGLQGHRDDAIYLEPGASFDAVGLTITPACSTSNPLFYTDSNAQTVMTGVRDLTVIEPTCAAGRRQLARTPNPLLGPGVSLTTCATNPSACGKLAMCTDASFGSNYPSMTTPACTCVLPMLPEESDALSAEVAPFVAGCRNRCPGGQVLLHSGICGCQEGLYATDEGICLPCEMGRWSLAGSTSCDVCMRGEYRFDTATHVRNCKPCVEGATCPTDSVLSSLIVSPAHWRLGPNTTSIRVCTVVHNGGNQTSPCVGGSDVGVDGNGYCRAGHNGPLCETCDTLGWAFIKAEGSCQLCPESGDIAQQIVGIIAVLVAIALLLVGLFWLTNAKNWPIAQRWSRWFLGMCVALNPTAKLKIVYAFLQIVIMMPSIYGVQVPPEYTRWMRTFSWIQISVFQLAPGACIGNYTQQLTFLAILPLGFMFAIVLLCVLWVTVKGLVTPQGKEEGKGQESGSPPPRSVHHLVHLAKHGLAIGLPPCIVIAFCMLPSVSSGLFETFDCERFVANDATNEVHYYLATALTIRCSMDGHTNPTYDTARSTALGLITIWPLGMPLATLLTMIMTRGALLAKRGTFWTRATAFLTREYRPECYWWEVVEIARRLALTGVVLLLIPIEEETMRLIFAQVITLISLLAVALIAPYKRRDNNTLALISQVMLLFILLIAQLLKLYEDFDETVLQTETVSRVMGFKSPLRLSAVMFATCVIMAAITLSVMFMQAKKFISHRRQQMRDALAGLTRFKYSFTLVSLSKFMEAGRLVTHEEMRDAGALTVFDLWEDALNFAKSGKCVLFFSHQWLGWFEPDPNNVHYPVMLKAVKALSSKFGHKDEDVYIWIDYSCIPQKNKSSQLAAIDSIANYAALSKYFIVVAPETTHHNTGLTCDAQTYLGRGCAHCQTVTVPPPWRAVALTRTHAARPYPQLRWCRLEQWAGMAASSSTDHMYLYEQGNLHKLSERPQWIIESVNVFTGKFTSSADNGTV